ncbi:MAG: hypothetical protein O2931_00225 [Planctomycetota bacterium]|nr:hypothetical protein [Planctomycetota bacterium]
MVLEKDILSLSEWLLVNSPVVLFLAILLTALGLLTGFLIAVLRKGPLEAFGIVARNVFEGLSDLTQLSPRRLGAMTWLAVQEAIRRKILIAFAVFVVILLFAGWFLDRSSEDPAQLYISFVLSTSNFLVLVLGIFISTFSLPNDIKNRTVYTIVTKPVRIWEILLGRMLGFTLVGTMLLAMMCGFSYVFVVRGLDHRHNLQQFEAEHDAEDTPSGDLSPTGDKQAAGENQIVTEPEKAKGLASPNTNDGSADGRRTTHDHFHRHSIQQNDDGSLQTDFAMAHQHSVIEENDKFRFGPPIGMLQARVPVAGTLRFKDDAGNDAVKGINVGSEWGYRSYVAGRTLAAAIFTFANITEGRFPRDKYPHGLPLEMTIRVFRTYKGIIDQRIQGSITLKNPDPNVPNEQARQRSTPFIFEPSEFYPKQEAIPWKLKLQRPDGTTDNGDLMKDLVHDGKIEVWIQCEDRQQYFGVARNDVYLRAADRPFWLNFIKSYVSIWCQMFIVICFGVMFSTVLSGPVAMLAAAASLVMGYMSTFVTELVFQQVEGGGPIEALIRVLTQLNLSIDLGFGWLDSVIKTIDWVLLLGMRGITAVLPNFENFATTHIIAPGFDIPTDYVLQHLFMAGAFFILVSVAGYFLFKSREIAA